MSTEEERKGATSSEHDASTARSSTSPPADAGMETSTDIIDFDGPDDPYNALNWPFHKKFVTTMLYSFCTMGATFASTVYNSGIVQVQRHFNVSSEVALLGMSLYLFGYLASLSIVQRFGTDSNTEMLLVLSYGHQSQRHMAESTPSSSRYLHSLSFHSPLPRPKISRPC